MEQLAFDGSFFRTTGHKPFAWQRRLFEKFRVGEIPRSLDLPTGLGKTSVMAIWYLARQAGADLPRRLVYVVDRRAVVDQATREAEKLKTKTADPDLRVSTLRGQYADNRAWLENPAASAIVVGTVDMVGSRLLFSGYGVSRWMRPYHAGLLGVDALVVLDESHLVPPFERLLRAVEDGRRGGCRGHSLAAVNESDRALVPNFRLLCLSATGRTEEDKDVFQIEPEDCDDSIVRQRLDAKKTLSLYAIDCTAKPNDEQLAQALADEAWALSDEGAAPSTVIVYCDSREVAEKTEAKLKTKAAKNRVSSVEIELLVGARRVRERTEAQKRLGEIGFLSGDAAARDGPGGPSFLVATAAGEVGIDLDADHMVCDLVAFERLVQRFGRVNRRGNNDSAEIRLLVSHGPKPSPQNKDKSTDKEKMWEVKEATKKLILKLPDVPGRDNDLNASENISARVDVSPRALFDLKCRAREDKDLDKRMAMATTPEPLYPALTRPLVDAWSMTALDDHSGRPEVGPWLRGWVDDEAQTSVIWRKYLPVRAPDEVVPTGECEAFFRAAPPHLSERLETETHRVAEWLIARAKADPVDDPDGLAEAPTPLSEKTIVAFVLDDRGAVSGSWPLGDLKSMKRDDLHKALAGWTLVVDARLGGLSGSGLLDKKHTACPVTADSDAPWLCEEGSADRMDMLGFQVDRRPADSAAEDHTAHSFVTERSKEGEPREFLHVRSRLTESSRSTAANAQLLADHHKCVEEKADELARHLGLPENHRRVFVLAARLHDKGKCAKRWQRAANAADHRIWAKTKGPFRPHELNGYRHEFGSLPHIERDAEFAAFSPELQDLTLHLVAAHHGRARPVMPTLGCDDTPPTALEGPARDIALRFARLQERWGPWGLAWFETLLRAADQQASRDNDAAGGTG